MKFVIESETIDDYLLELNEVNVSNPDIQTLIGKLFSPNQTDIEKVQLAFEFVRNEISHSWDIQSELVTCTASDVLKYKQGDLLC